VERLKHKLQMMKTNNMTSKIKYVFSIFSLSCSILISCQKEPTSKFDKFTPDPCSDSVFFNSEIMPQIINKSCSNSSCHNSTWEVDGLDFTSHDKIVPITHSMYKAMAHDSGYIPMPSAEVRIADSLIQKFYCWIQQGKLNN